MHKCLHCPYQNTSYDSVRKHAGRIHQIPSQQFYTEYHLNGIAPVCKCGCGAPVRWRAGKFQEWINGHNAVGSSNPMYGKSHTKEAKASISKVRKQMFAEGKLHMWSEGKSVETDPTLQQAAKKISENKKRARKISKALKGKKHSKEHRINVDAAIKKAWENPELRERQRKNRVELFKKRLFNTESKLEKFFGELLDIANVKYEKQFNLNSYLFDFKVKDAQVLIEVDGDFHHCNPIKFPDGPKCETQKDVTRNDAKKNKIAKKNGYTLLRFWESDINDSPSKVIKILLNAIE